MDVGFFQFITATQFTVDDFFRQEVPLLRGSDRNLPGTLVAGVAVPPGAGDHIRVEQAGLNGDVIPAVHVFFRVNPHQQRHEGH